MNAAKRVIRLPISSTHRLQSFSPLAMFSILKKNRITPQTVDTLKVGNAFSNSGLAMSPSEIAAAPIIISAIIIVVISLDPIPEMRTKIAAINSRISGRSIS